MTSHAQMSVWEWNEGIPLVPHLDCARSYACAYMHSGFFAPVGLSSCDVYDDADCACDVICKGAYYKDTAPLALKDSDTMSSLWIQMRESLVIAAQSHFQTSNCFCWTKSVWLYTNLWTFQPKDATVLSRGPVCFTQIRISIIDPSLVRRPSNKWWCGNKRMDHWPRSGSVWNKQVSRKQ